MTQTTLKGGRTSATVPIGTSPTAAAAAARASQTNPKAPSADGAKGGKGSKKGDGKGGAADADYELDIGGAGGGGGDDGPGPRTIAGFGVLLPGEDENEALEGGPRRVEKGERADGKFQDKAGKWRDVYGHYTTAPEILDMGEQAVRDAQKEVLAKHTGAETLEASTYVSKKTGEVTPGFPKGQGSLIDKFRAVFAEDKRPDTPVDDATKREQSDRDKYMDASQRAAEQMRHGGRPRTSDGRFASSITVTIHGAVQIRDARGRVRETVRSPYKSGGGQFTGNIEPPITRDASSLREAVDKRLEKYGTSLFQDRAKLSPRRLAAMRIAFTLDRKERGWPVPDWGMDL